MRRAEQACVALGGALVVTGIAMVFVPAAIAVAGGFLMAAGWPRGEPS